MAISNRDREILLRQINRLLLDTPTFEVGDVARVIENSGTSLRKGSVATVTKVLSENEVAVTTRHHDGQESFGVIPNNQLQKVEPLGEDIDGNQVNLYDLIEGVGDHFNGELLLVVGVDEDGVGIAHPVKIRLKPVVETHLDYRIPLDQARLTTMDEWCEPRNGDVVEVGEVITSDDGELKFIVGDYCHISKYGAQHFEVFNSERKAMIHKDELNRNSKTVLRK